MMKYIKIGALLTVFALLAVGCGSENNKAEEYGYDFTQNGCWTGKHTFNSKDAYCNALKDEALNKGCAYSIRQEAFQRDCPGHTW